MKALSNLVSAGGFLIGMAALMTGQYYDHTAAVWLAEHTGLKGSSK